MSRLTSLPEELILKILLYNGFQEIRELSTTCRLLRRIAHDSSIWSRLLHQLLAHAYAKLPPHCTEADDAVALDTTQWLRQTRPDASSQDLYSALHRCVSLLGVWRTESSAPRGTCVYIAFTDDAHFLRAVIVRGVADESFGLQQELFRIKLEPYTTKLNITSPNPDDNQLESLTADTFTFMRFDYVRCRRTTHHTNPLHRCEGLFTSMYGPHGREIIFVEQSSTGAQFCALKLTGDPNVPCGKLSWTANTTALPPRRESSETVYSGNGHLAHTGFVDDWWVSGELVTRAHQRRFTFVFDHNPGRHALIYEPLILPLRLRLK